MEVEDAPYALKDHGEQQRRQALMRQAHMVPLAELTEAIRAGDPARRVPELDPCDGGVRAKVLLLLEAPGPKAVSSGFVSRNNPDPTAKNLCELLRDAHLARADTLIANIVPWYVGTSDASRIRPVTRLDIREAMPYLKMLLALLTDLRAVVLVGRKAQSAEAELRLLTRVPFFQTYHPSGQVFYPSPHRRDEALVELRRVAAFLDGSERLGAGE